MSTTIKSALTRRTLELYTAIDAQAGLTIRAGDGEPTDITVPTADLLAAIEAEGIGIVVEGTTPEVTVDGDLVAVGDFAWEISSLPSRNEILTDVLKDLALLRWLDANPPAPEVDEADVEALAREMVGPDLNPVELARMMPAARRAITSGRVTVTR